MKKSEIASRVANRVGTSRSAAGDAVDAVFEAVGEALAMGEEVRDRRIRDIHDKEPAGRYRAQSTDRGKPRDPGLNRAGVQAGKGAQRCGE